MQAEAAYKRKNSRVISIVPYSVKGKYRNTKSLILAVVYCVYFTLPWLTWSGKNRTGQALLFDIHNSRFHLFDLTIFPQDLMILMAVLVFAAALLFISASLYGRIFCGFFCFQTLWTDAFRMLETLVQGGAQARLRLRKQAWNLEKLYKIVTTHVLWLSLALATALTFTLYFTEARTLIPRLLSGEAPWVAYFTIFTITTTTYIAAGLAREDICRVACPYGKFQSAMQDPITRTVIYDAQRGERTLGRALPNKTIKDASLRADSGYGDCIDCGYCVNVCPTGVDIRNGFQIDCISCGLCVDACDTIMESVNLPTGLIRFDRAASQQPVDEQQSAGSSAPQFKFKEMGYLFILLASFSFVVYQIGHLEPFSATIQQQSQPLVTRLSNGDLKSRYIVRLTNKSSNAEQYMLQAEGLPPATVNFPQIFTVPAGKTYTYTFNLIFEKAALKDISSFTLQIIPANNPQHTKSYPLTHISRL